MNENDEGFEIDLLEVWDIILANYKPIAKITGVFVALAVLYLLIAAPVYESKALLQIKQEQGLGSSLLDAATGGNVALSQQKMSTYAEILKTKEVVVPVIEATEEEKDGKFLRRERYTGAMTRSFYVGEDITEEDVKAKFGNGVLTLSLPKEAPKKIEEPKYICIE